MTHEYVIGLAGVIGAGGGRLPVPTAIAWAADRVLAIGSDAEVRAISRGDSIFLDLAGCRVTALPEGLTVPAAGDGDGDGDGDPRVDLRAATGDLESGDTADLAFWQAAPGRRGRSVPDRWRLVAVVRSGAFTQGEPHHGPFGDASEVALPNRAATDRPAGSGA
jgi:hypothetical protein